MGDGRRGRVWLSLAAAALIASAAFAIVPAGAAAGGGVLLPSQDPFYAYAGSLNGIAPGTVLRTRRIQVADLGISTPIVASQVLYRTTGELGQPTVTVATIIRPLVRLGKQRIVSYQTAYDSLGPECDPSYTLQGGNPSYQSAEVEVNAMLAYVAAGYTVVTADYEGETLDYGAGQESGYGTLDGIRAAENALKLAATSTPVGMIGYSGGAIATEYASELAPTYSPELDIVGTAEGGVAVDYAHNLQYISGSQAWSGVIPAVLLGVARGFHIDLNPYLSSYGRQVLDQVSGECISSFLGAYPGLTPQKLAGPQYQDFYKVPLFVKVINKMIMSTDGTPKGPLLIGNGNADGTGDGVMVVKDVEALAHTYCQRGVSVQFTVYNGLDHIEAVVPFEAAALTFLTARLTGHPVPNGCRSIGAGNPLTPLPSAAQPSHTRQRLEYRYLGSNRRRHTIAIAIRMNTGRLRGLVVRLRQGRRLIDTVHVRSVGTVNRRIVLRVRERGRYTLTIGRGRRTLLRRTI